MQTDNWNFELYLEYLGQPAPSAGATERVKEHHYFHSLHDAFFTLIDEVVPQLHADKPRCPSLYDFPAQAVIYDRQRKTTLLQVGHLPGKDGRFGELPAGLYLNLLIGQTGFEQQSGLNLSGLQGAAKRCPYYLLAVPDSDHEQLELSPGLLQMRKDMRYSGRLECEHVVQVKSCHFEDQYRPDPNTPSYYWRDSHFYYGSLREAFKDTLQINTQRWAGQVFPANGIGHYIEEVNIRDRQNMQQQLRVFSNFEDPRRDDNSPPELLMRFYPDAPTFEQKCDVDLSGLADTERLDPYRVVARYDDELFDFIPTDGLLALQKQLNAVPSYQPSYLLELRWRPVTGAMAHDLSKDLVQQQRFNDIQGAVKALLSHDEQRFKKEQMSAAGLPVYIASADILDAGNSTVCMSRFLVSNPGEGLPTGVYIKIDPDNLSLANLKATYQLLDYTHQQSAGHFLICEGKDKMPTPASQPERRPVSGERKINPSPGNSTSLGP